MRDVRVDRRLFLRGLGGVAAGVVAASSLTACGAGTSRSAGSSGSSGKSTKAIVVRNSGGSYGEANQKAIYEPFTKETGIQVKVVNIAYAQMLAQIKQGRPQFDVIDDSMADFVLFRQQGATEELDYDRLKNFKNAGIAKSLVTPTAIGKNYWSSVMAYRTDAFGGRKPESWADFWDTRAFGGSRSLQALDADLPELEFALLADGVPLDKLYPLDVERAFKALDEIKGSVKKYWDTGALPGVLLGRKEVVASSVWQAASTTSSSTARRSPTSGTALVGRATAWASPRAPRTSTPRTSSSTSRCGPRCRRTSPSCTPWARSCPPPTQSSRRTPPRTWPAPPSTWRPASTWTSNGGSRTRTP